MANKAKAEESAVMTVPEAGAKLGLNRQASYNAAARGEIPVLRFGKIMRVPKAAIDQMLTGAITANPARKQIA